MGLPTGHARHSGFYFVAPSSHSGKSDALLQASSESHHGSSTQIVFTGVSTRARRANRARGGRHSKTHSERLGVAATWRSDVDEASESPWTPLGAPRKSGPQTVFARCASPRIHHCGNQAGNRRRASDREVLPRARESCPATGGATIGLRRHV